jgi:hypothetical protein
MLRAMRATLHRLTLAAALSCVVCGCSSSPSKSHASESAPPTTSPTASQQNAIPTRGAVAAGIKAPPATRLAETDEFGLVRGIRQQHGALLFDVDRVNMLSGDEATAAATAQGEDVSNDYFLVNASARVRHYELSPSAVVWGSLGLTGSVDATRVSVDAWSRFVERQPGRETLFHFDVEHGVVVGIEEQYRP